MKLVLGAWGLLAACEQNAPVSAAAARPPLATGPDASARKGSHARVESTAGIETATPRPNPRLLGSNQTLEEIEAGLRTGMPASFHPVGTSSVVFRVALDGERAAAFKPKARSHPRGHLAEVAAYRLASRLGFDNVPPAVLRGFARRTVREHLDPKYVSAWPEIDAWTLWRDDQMVGALIHWLPDLRTLPLERAAAMARWTDWLRQPGKVPADQAQLARDLSRMLVFDFLIGNWDRFSGGNVQGPTDGSRLYIRDHNVAFDRLSPQLEGRILSHLLRTERFSRSLITRLQELDEMQLRETLFAELGGQQGPLLIEPAIDALLERREVVLSYVASLTSAYGEKAVLAFP